MEQALKDRIEALLSEAELATDEKANGLMDRADFQHIILQLAQTTRELMSECSHLQQDCDSYASRLNRKPQLHGFDSFVDYHQDEVRSF